MTLTNDFVLFIVEGKTYGIPSDNFERVFRSVEITSLPNAPTVIQGVFNLHGDIIPVINIRNRFGIPDKPINISDKLLVLNFTGKRFAILVDEILGLFNNQLLLESKELYDGIDYVSGLIKLNEELAIICNTEKLFQPEDESFINQTIHDLEL